MGFDFIVIAPLIPSHCGFSFVFGFGVSFLVSSSVFLSMIVQQLVVIPVFLLEEVRARPSSPPSWTNLPNFNFLKNHPIAFHNSCAILHSHQQCTKGSSFSASLPTLVVLCFLIVVILRGVRWYIIVVLICISLMISDVKHLFTCLLAICISSLEKCLFKSFAYFWIRLFVLLLNFRSSLCILDIIPLSDMWFANIFSDFVDFLFTLLVFSFNAQHLKIFMKPNLFILLLLSVSFMSYSKIHWQIQCCETSVLMFSSKSFIF